jgi:hypothetical protein
MIILYSEGEEKKMLETHYHSIVDIVPLPEKIHQDSSNAFAKDCMIKTKEATRDVKETTWKANQTNYYEVSISYI